MDSAPEMGQVGDVSDRTLPAVQVKFETANVVDAMESTNQHGKPPSTRQQDLNGSLLGDPSLITRLHVESIKWHKLSKPV